MSTLTQFFPQGDSFLGEMIAGPSAFWGGNPTFSGKEYLRTGLIKSYTSDYAGLLQALPTACIANFTADDYYAAYPDWNFLFYNGGSARSGAWYGPPSLYYLGGNYHIHHPCYSSWEYWYGYTYVIKYGSSLSSAPTNQFQIAGDFVGYTGNASYDSILFNNKIIISYLTPNGTNSNKLDLWYSTGGAYSKIYDGQAGNVNATWLAASPTLCVSLGNVDNTSSPRIVTSTDGTTWTERTSNLNMGPPVRFFYSQSAEAFFYITSNANIYTSTDGYTWTQRTPPTGMQAAIGGVTTHATWADTPSASYVVLGSPNTTNNYLLKITSVTDFSLIDLATTGSGNLVGLFSGSTSMYPLIHWNGTYLSLIQGRIRAYSTDGINWSLDTYLNQTFNGNAGNPWPVRNYINNNLVHEWFASPGSGGTSYGFNINAQNKSYGATPNFVGSSSTFTFATGTSLSTYFRIK